MAGAPGCYSDITMYRASGIQDWIDHIKTKNVKLIAGIPVGYYINADGIYKCQPGVMTPHDHRDKDDNGRLSRAQRNFDFRQSSTRMVIEQTFGILKARWRILDNFFTSGYSAEKCTSIFTACCVLHNWCLLHSDVWPRIDELPVGHHHSYANIARDGIPATTNTRLPEMMGKAQRTALMVALEVAHSYD